MIGKTLGHFKITEKLGEGGMGEVYRAHDEKLGRDVALKVLPEELARDADRIARFRREARTLASLQHGNIASIYGIEDIEGHIFLEMELVEGEDLSDRIERGPIPVEEATSFAAQMAEGLEAAHERGIVHRDLKPANIKVSPDGEVKILDFGLARAFADEDSIGSGSNLLDSPTLTQHATQAGIILGTAAYMSPEQARGKRVDKRADIWSFGLILLEMLDGERVFAGETVSDTLAAVLRKDVSLDKLPASTPITLRMLMERCLTRDPKDRLRDIGEARIALQRLPSEGEAPVEGPQAKPPRHPLLTALALIIVAATASFAAWSLRPAMTPAIYNLSILPPVGHQYSYGGLSLSLSPDGRMVAFTAVDSVGQSSLWVRDLGLSDAQLISGTAGANFPFWSPDGEFLGFFASGMLKKVGVRGGSPQSLCDASAGVGGSWGKDGTIVLSPSFRSPLYRVSDAGGEPVAITQLDSLSVTHRWPSLLQDGKHFIYLAQYRDIARYYAQSGEIRIASLDGTHDEKLVDSIAGAVYARGHLFYLQEGALMARPLDTGSLRLTGTAIRVADSIPVLSFVAKGPFDVSASGALVHARGRLFLGHQIGVYDRSGTPLSNLSLEMELDDLALSRDDRWLTFMGSKSNESVVDVWTYDLQRDLPTRVSFDGGSDDPVWSSDGSQVVFASYGDLHVKRSSGLGDQQLLHGSPIDKVAHDWAPDNSAILFSNISGQDNEDLWLLPVRWDGKSLAEATGDAQPVLTSQHREYHARFSPSGKWIAYTSNESGENQVYAIDYPDLSRRVQLSVRGGSMPMWSGDGKEVFFLQNNSNLFVVAIEEQDDAIQVSPATPLFSTRVELPSIRTHHIAVSSDGQTFYTIEPKASEANKLLPLNLVTDILGSQ